MSAPCCSSPNGSSSGSLPASQTILVLIYGMACPLRCDFCCHPVEEYGGARIGVERAVDWIAQAALLPSFSLVVFSGGEPLLYEDDLREIMQRSKGTGLGFRIVTAAHWAKDDATTLATLKRLQACGLTELSLSTDPSHQRFVPRQQVERAARIAVELGLVCEIASVFWQPGQTALDVATVPLGATSTEGLAVPIGRGKDRKVTPADYQLGDERFGACSEGEIVDVTVYPTGDVYPCCSGGFNMRAKLEQGNLDSDPLSQIVDRILQDQYLQLALIHGLGSFLDVIAFKFPELRAKIPPLQELVSSCQVCALLHGDVQLAEELAPAVRYAARLFSTVQGLALEHPPQVASALEPMHG